MSGSWTSEPGGRSQDPGKEKKQMIDLVGGRVEPVELEDEMQRSFLEYAMSVIMQRALPDVRDGLKPVHRRILYSMGESGLAPNQPHRKCARVVGDVMGRYHPHGDAAIYDTLVRMAQDFSYRYELVDGHGNFGSVDGDSAAAMRYTEARLAQVALEILEDIKKETVDFIDNYDGSMQEPVVLPGRFPNLLVNGASGIAVGMATNIPPHNLVEVADATIALIDNPDITLEDLMQHIHGPDFPTGGRIMGREGIFQAYSTGRGIIQVRARAHFEELKGGRERIAITEIPYQVNKSKLTEKIAELVKAKTLVGISDLRDESDRSGMRLVIELKKDTEPEVVLNQLYKHTQMQNSFGIIMLALVDGVPRTMPLKQLIRKQVEHRQEVVVRRTKFDLRKAEERAHILEGLLVALDHLDETIALIRASKTVEDARAALIKRFKLSEEQAQAILDMRLQRLTGLERQKLKDELKELHAKIAEYKEILADPDRVLIIIKEEMEEIKRKYGDDRRSEIVGPAEDLSIEDLIAEEEMVITITHSGYAKRVPVTTFRKQKRGGRGVTGMDLKEGDFVEHLFITTTHHFILFFSNRGKVYRLKVHELPTGSRQSKGKAMVNLLPLEPGEKIVEVISTKDFSPEQYLVTGTKNGIVKKTRFDLYDSARKDGIIALKLFPGDEMIRARLTSGNEELLLISEQGQAIKFNERDCRPMGRAAAGVKGINLNKGDQVLTMEVPQEGADVFVITSNGYGKRTSARLYPLHKRGGKGVRTIKLTETKGVLAGARIVRDNQELFVVSQEGIVIRVPINGIPRTGRATQGVKVMRVQENDRVSAVALVVAGDDSNAEEDYEGDDDEISPEEPDEI
jgi:DNA gyrase subunit A